jgi:hypothetical protein
MSEDQGGSPPVRASNADRQAVADALRAASADGRITLAEFDERVTAAYAAKTRDELASPPSPPPVPPAPQGPKSLDSA